MNETSRTLQTIERLIRARFHKQFGDRHRIDSIVGSSFDRKGREVNYITVLSHPWRPTTGPPGNQRLRHPSQRGADVGHGIHDWPAIAFVAQDRGVS